MNKAEELADKHWKDVDEILKHDGVSLKDRWVIGFHYRRAFVLGYDCGSEGLV